MGRPRRIGLFHCVLPEAGRKPGGVEVAVHRLANALARDTSDRITVYSLTPPPADAEYRHVRLFECCSFLARRRVAKLLLLPTALNGVAFDEDVLHIHGDDWFYFNRRLPTVRTLHGSAVHEARTATSFKRKVSQYAIYTLEHLAGRLATVSLGVGPDTNERYRTHDRADNGVDLEAFRPGEKSPAPSLLFVGTWAGRKRGEFLYQQFVRTIRPAVPAAELFMVCDREPPPAEGVRFVPTPSDDRLAALFRAAWVFAYPSIYEGFGMAYLEAMASGTAVVASPNQGASYVIQDGQSGHIVDDADFAPTIIRLLLDSAERERLAAAGRVAATEFSWDRVADAHRAAYETAIERWRQS